MVNRHSLMSSHYNIFHINFYQQIRICSFFFDAAAK
uniref:Uncharacterized protein n=1 Tax=Anguilla anguilla TaxID=7936 RepID=A0A0E9PNG2_ANGAN